MALLSGNSEYFTFSIAGLDESLRVAGFTGKESVSHPFKYQLELVCDNAELDFDFITGRPGVITFFNHEKEAERYIHGFVNKISQTRHENRFTTYHIELVPGLMWLSYRHNLRIFQELTVEEIIKKIFNDAGMPPDQFNFLLQGRYESRDYCVQYRETDLAFVSRLMEEEGLFYYFEHTVDNHVLTIADNVSVCEPVSFPEIISFHLPDGMIDPDDIINDFSFLQQIETGKVSLKDYNYFKPALCLLKEKEAKFDQDLVCYDYPADFSTPERGEHLANVRLEEKQALRNKSNGSGNCKRFLPGYLFRLSGYPREDLNQQYLITSVSHTGLQPGVKEEQASYRDSEYSNNFECIPEGVPFRPERITRKPVVEGVQTAIVVGPEGEEIYTDELGRIKVQFHWDREGQLNEHSSCWIRVGQLFAGAGYGALFLPRIGQEVIVSFLDGEPDRPIITGCVYHGTNKPPYALPDNKTRTTIKTNSSKGGEGFNELSFEDKVGEENVLLSAQRNMEFRVGRNKAEFVLAESNEKVGFRKELVVGGDYNTTVGVEMNEKVLGNRNEKIVGKKTVLIGKKLDVTIEGNEKYLNRKKKVQLVNNASIHKANNIYLEADDKIEFKVGNSSFKITNSEITLNSSSIKINGSRTVNVKGGLVRIN